MLKPRSLLNLNCRTHSALPRVSILRPQPQPPVPLCRARHRIGSLINNTTPCPGSFNRSFSSHSPYKMSFPPIDTTIVCPALNLLPENTQPDCFASDLAFFASLPWTAALLKAPDAIPFLPSCRNPASPKHDQLFGRELNTDRGLSHFLSFFRAPSVAAAQDPSQNVLEIVTLVSVGEGVSGFPGVVHGGIVASLLDESMGNIFDLNQTLGKEARAFKTASVTGGLDVKFLKPVPTNSVFCVTATVEEIEDRKTSVRCELKDAKGETLAKCSSKWVALKSNL
ncbi:hypothetical protein FDECE_13653 [Fusarium decemcellulare]|nr:hypothetical protein FDECE_13653 [Fusarium decemcellulare]